MSLREAFRQTLDPELRVARAKERNCATLAETAQLEPQPARNDIAVEPRQASIRPATRTATVPQQASCAPSKTDVRNATPRNFGPMTAHRLEPALVNAINRACAARGDDEANRLGLIDECRALPPDGQAGMYEHFTQVADKWEGACGTLEVAP